VARLHIRLSTIVAVALVATVVMTAKARADDNDAYFDCVIGKAEAIMKTQARKDAEAALSKAYALCQDVGLTRLARINDVSLLPHRAAPLYPLVNS
jgi:Tfp pilus assembly protein PilF